MKNDLRYACMQRGHVGYACLEIGAHADAERFLHEALEGATRLGLWNVAATAKHNLGRALQYRGRLEEALEVEQQACDAFRSHNDRRLEGAARVYSAYILAEMGHLDRALAELETALDSAAPPMRPQILASIARVMLQRAAAGEASDPSDAADARAGALVHAREAISILDALGGVEEGESLVRLVLAEALEAAGQPVAAREAARRARTRLLARAAAISDRNYRRSFLENVAENAATLALATRLRADRDD